MDLRHPRARAVDQGGARARREEGALIRDLPWCAKLGAFGAHFSISVVVFAVIIALTVELWYPPPFFWIDGALHVTILAAIVDIFAGPLCTLVVYRPGKPRLARDLAVIALVQFAALLWGVKTMYSQRPLAAAFVPHNDNRFYPVTEAQLRSGPRPVEEVLALSKARPALVFIELPTDPAEADRILKSRDQSVLRQTERFRPIDGERLERVRKASRSPARYDAITPAFAASMRRFIETHGGDPSAFAFIPLYGRFGYAILAIARDGSVAGVAAREIHLH